MIFKISVLKILKVYHTFLTAFWYRSLGGSGGGGDEPFVWV